MNPKTKTKRTLALGWLTVSGAHPLDQIDAALAGGFDAVGLRLVPPAPGDPMVPVVGDEPLIREMLSRLPDTGITVLDVETVWIGPDLDVKALAPMMDVARRLGARHLLSMGNDPDMSRLAAHFATLCEQAFRFGMNVGMEFAAYTHVPTLAAADHLICAAGQPNGRILIDSLHFSRSGGMPREISVVDPSRLGYCQLGDARGPRPADAQALRAEARSGRYLPGEGELPLAQIVEALPAEAPLVIEAPCAQLAHLSIVERGRVAGTVARRFLERPLEGNRA